MTSISFDRQPLPVRLHQRIVTALGKIPHSLIAFLGRFSIAAVFWQSGQTKVEGLAIDLVHGVFDLGVPHLSESAVDLFRDEYALPLLPPELAATMAASAEHVLPIFLLIGLGTRYAALGLLGMTLVIEIFVYPNAYPVHGTWATILLYLIARGPGKLSIDHWIANRYR
jgi:putative oxidoreductase